MSTVIHQTRLSQATRMRVASRAIAMRRYRLHRLMLDMQANVRLAHAECIDVHEVIVETQGALLMAVCETFTRDGARRVFLRHIDNPCGAGRI